MNTNEPQYIVVKGAKVHNLKNVTLSIPRNKLVVLTGVSGSGKSSMAFDTIYAEGQRRYVESLSSYARQFLGVMDKPDVESIEGLSPAISIDQKSTSHNPRSTVGTITEIYDYLRLLFARVGHPHCPSCGREISQQTLPQIVDMVLGLITKSKDKLVRTKGLRIIILAPLIKDRKGEYSKLFENLKKKGYSKVRIDGEIHALDEDLVLIKTNKHTIDVIIDRVVLMPKTDPDASRRLSGSLETALKLGEGNVIVAAVSDKSFDFPENPKITEDHLFSERFACPVCNLSLPFLEPRNFSFNSPHGACPACTGLGTTLKIDPDLILSPNLSIAEGGVLPWSRLFAHDSWSARMIEVVARAHHFSLATPIKTLSQQALNIVLYGTGNELFEVSGENRYGRRTSFDTKFEGVVNNLERRYKETDSDFIRHEIERFMRIEPCIVCHGKRLKPESLSVTIEGQSIIDVCRQAITDFKKWVSRLTLIFNEREQQIAEPIVKELQARINFLIDVGLDYLTIDRAANSLAGGEAQRIRLASQIGSGLAGVLYVLDEPTIGLHPRDNAKLIKTLKELRDLGNTVIVVEHDAEMMENADWIVDFGPGAGEKGGQVVFAGTPSEIKKSRESLTGQYLSGQRRIEIPARPTGSKTMEKLGLYGCSQHNLKQIEVEFPLNKLIAVSGVSGSGKSTLINDTLYYALKQHFGQSLIKPGAYQEICGLEYLDKVVNVDQSPIGRTPRSNPATYTGVFSYIRDLYAKTLEAQMRGYLPGRFSFNVKGGRCEACQGDGFVKIEMQFLPDVYVECEVCHGKRYNNETLEINFKEKNIAEVLDLTVEDALHFFENIPQIRKKLQVLDEVGLGYIRLGQPAPTLSGGEAQRVKLSTELSKQGTGRTLYLLDEPTTGLHFYDVEKLIQVLRRLVSKGNTVIIIEHNLEVLKNADYILDLGPGGGDDGGRVVTFGTPLEISRHPTSYTGHYLQKLHLGGVN